MFAHGKADREGACDTFELNTHL